MRFISKEVRTFTPSSLAKGNDSVGPKVIAAGLPRCATSSIQAALSDHLGYAPCLHMEYVMPYPARLRLLTAAFQEEDKTRRQAILRPLFDSYNATADYPGCLFLDDLLEMYPSAQVVLNLRARGADDWQASIQSTLGWFYTRAFRVTSYWSRPDYELYRKIQHLDKFVERRFNEIAHSFWDVRLYDKHNAWVKEVARRHGKDVLDFTPTMGWNPLCDFLGKPVPQGVEFPRVNDKNFMHFVIFIMYARGVLLWTAVLGVPWVAWWAGRYFRLI